MGFWIMVLAVWLGNVLFCLSAVLVWFLSVFIGQLMKTPDEQAEHVSKERQNPPPSEEKTVE